MINKEQIEMLTKAYITSYNTAMEQVKNPEFATQIAMGVLMVANMAEQNNSKSSVKVLNPLEIIFSQVAKQVQEEEGEEKKSHDRTENETN